MLIVACTNRVYVNEQPVDFHDIALVCTAQFPARSLQGLVQSSAHCFIQVNRIKVCEYIIPLFIPCHCLCSSGLYIVKKAHHWHPLVFAGQELQGSAIMKHAQAHLNVIFCIPCRIRIWLHFIPSFNYAYTVPPATMARIWV